MRKVNDHNSSLIKEFTSIISDTKEDAENLENELMSIFQKIVDSKKK